MFEQLGDSDTFDESMKVNSQHVERDGMSHHYNSYVQVVALPDNATVSLFSSCLG
jgi:hypothetical protein